MSEVETTVDSGLLQARIHAEVVAHLNGAEVTIASDAHYAEYVAEHRET